MRNQTIACLVSAACVAVSAPAFAQGVDLNLELEAGVRYTGKVADRRDDFVAGGTATATAEYQVQRVTLSVEFEAELARYDRFRAEGGDNLSLEFGAGFDLGGGRTVSLLQKIADSYAVAGFDNRSGTEYKTTLEFGQEMTRGANTFEHTLALSLIADTVFQDDTKEAELGLEWTHVANPQLEIILEATATLAWADDRRSRGIALDFTTDHSISAHTKLGLTAGISRGRDSIDGATGGFYIGPHVKMEFDW